MADLPGGFKQRCHLQEVVFSCGVGVLTHTEHLSLQVQGVQSLQGLQLPQGQGQAQQLTLAPVQTLPLGQPGQVSLPNLQTVTVNSVTQSGVQYTQGEDANSPTGMGPSHMFAFSAQTVKFSC